MIKNMRYPVIAVLVVLCIIINSCKRDDVNSIPKLLTTGYWQLGSMTTLRYIGDRQIAVIIDSCNIEQAFTFKTDNTCTYTNFGCDSSIVPAKWSLNNTRTFLQCDLTVPDSTGKLYQPFTNARINNLGDFSFVLETGDIQPYYNSTDARTIVRWGFVRKR